MEKRVQEWADARRAKSKTKEEAQGGDKGPGPKPAGHEGGGASGLLNGGGGGLFPAPEVPFLRPAALEDFSDEDMDMSD